MAASSAPEQLEQFFLATENQGVTRSGAVRRRLMPTSALDIFTEVRFPNRDWALLVQSKEPLEDRDLVLAAGLTCRTSSGKIEVVAGPHTDRRLFCTLLTDLLEQLPTSSATPAAAMTRRLMAWQRMLSRGRPAGMSPERQAGLYGELVVLRDLMLPAVGTDAIRAWSGPSGAAQDFTHLSTSVEVKTVSHWNHGTCRISSEAQLDPTGLRALFLVHQVTLSTAEGFTLAELIDELRSSSQVRADITWFENSLLEYGWLDAHRSQYAQNRYEISSRRCFKVYDDFPRLTPASLPPGISEISYLLDLSSCGHYEVTEEAVRQSLEYPATAAEGQTEHAG